MKITTGLWFSALLMTSLTLTAPAARAVDGYAIDTNGCRIFTPRYHPETTVHWSGSCSAGYAVGQGVAEWTAPQLLDGKAPYETWNVTLVAGKAEGHGEVTMARGFYHYEGQFANGVQSGMGRARLLDGTVQDGEWKEGKFVGSLPSNDTKVAVSPSQQASRANQDQSVGNGGSGIRTFDSSATDVPFGTSAADSGRNTKQYDSTECLKVRTDNGPDKIFNTCNRQIAVLAATCAEGGRGDWGAQNSGHICDDSPQSRGWYAQIYTSAFVLDPAGGGNDNVEVGANLLKEVGVRFTYRWAACTMHSDKQNLQYDSKSGLVTGGDACAEYVSKVAQKVTSTGQSPRYLHKAGQL